MEVQEEYTQDAKRPRLEMSAFAANLKLRVLNDFFTMVHRLCTDLSLTEAQKMNLSTMEQIGGAIYTIINSLRKKLNTRVPQQPMTYQATINVWDASVNPAIWREDVVSIQEKMDQYAILLQCGETTDERQQYFGTMMPLLELLTLFKLRLPEVRLGVSGFYRTSNQNKQVPISTLGLSSIHAPLLEGILYSPERRSALIMSTGACTQAYALAQQRDERYKGKYRNALQYSISHLPMAEELVNHFAGARDGRFNHDVMREMANILLITGDRHVHRIAVPIAVSYKMWRTVCKWDKTTGELTAKATTHFYDASGRLAYNMVKHFQITKGWTMSWGGQRIFVNQVVFHAMMGTACSAFETLKAITNHKTWYRRSEMGDAFKGTTNAPIALEPVQLLYASKMSSAAKNDLLASGTGTVSCSEPFSGRYQRTYTREFFNHVDNAVVGSSVARGNVQSLISSLVALKEALKTNIVKRNMDVKHGTTEWKRLDDYIVGAAETVQLNIVSSGDNFYTATKLGSN